MEIQNNKEEIPFSYYEEQFRAMDPMEAARRTQTNWDGEKRRFYVQLMHYSYIVTHPECKIFRLVDDGVPPLPVQTFILRYLLESKATDWNGTWKTFREMPWGELYIKPYTGRVLTRAAFTFGTRLTAFRAACEKLGATPVPNGDAGYEFSFIGGYKVRILVWEGDDEFPPNAQILYSDNFEDGFAPEDRVVTGDILITTIKSAM